MAFLPRYLVVALGHVESRLGRKFLLHHADEILVVGDDHQLEVGLGGTGCNDLTKRNRQSPFVLEVQVRSWLVKCDDAAIQAERFREGESNHDARQNTHLLIVAHSKYS